MLYRKWIKQGQTVVHKNVSKHKSDILWPSMNVEVILNKMKYLRIHNQHLYKFLSRSIHKWMC